MTKVPKTIPCDCCGVLADYPNKRSWEDWDITKLEIRDSHNLGRIEWKFYFCPSCAWHAQRVLGAKKILSEVKNAKATAVQCTENHADPRAEESVVVGRSGFAKETPSQAQNQNENGAGI